LSQPNLNHRLSSIDASFLYFEKKEASMHIGSVSLFDGEIPFDTFVAMLDSKMHLLPRYRQVVVPDPFGIGHPTWEFDQHFDVKQHIFKIQIEAPGGEAELIELAGRILTPMMDRRKPLWDIYLVYGLEGKRTAMIARVHHCMVDGVSGVDLLKIVLDISPDVPKIFPGPERPALAPRPDATRCFFDSLLGSMQEGMKRWMEFQNSLLRLTQTLTNEESRQSMCETSGNLPQLASPVSLLPFNRPCSGDRKLVWSTFSFAEARAIRAALGGTVNDVVLTALSGAVSRYVELHGQQTAGRQLRVMVPVSLRQQDQRGTLGNLVSMLPVEIPLDMPNPVERFQYINRKTAAMKGSRIAEGLNLFSALMGILPAPVHAFAGALATTPIPAFNMVSTNVPGPQVPLYAMGKRMIAYYPYVPVGYGIGCGCAIMSYDQSLYFGLTSDTQAMPDVEKLKEAVDQSFIELRAAAGVEEIKPKVMKARRGKRQ
jgi:diacylglycerol O-acyltransferase / wax synthase